MKGYTNEKYHWCPKCDEVMKPVNGVCDCERLKVPAAPTEEPKEPNHPVNLYMYRRLQ